MRWIAEPERNVWKRWFAWFPVRGNRDEMIWLEYVEREYTGGFDGHRCYNYRAID